MVEQGAQVLQAEARSYHDQNTADAVAGGQADVLAITDGAEAAQVHSWPQVGLKTDRVYCGSIWL